MPIRWRWYDWALAVAVFTIYALVIRRAFTSTLYFDDAYMYVRYAENLNATGTFGWNPGERTFGCTSIPFALWIALLERLGLGAISSPANLLRLGSLIWTVPAAWVLARVVFLASAGTPLAAGPARRALVASILLAPPLLGNLVTGMDTSLALLATSVLVLCFLRADASPTPGRLALAAGACGFVYLVRPDTAAYAIGFPPLFALSRPWNGRARALLLGGVAILLAAEIGATALYFGDPLPLPLYVKSNGFYEGYLGIFRWNAVEYAFDFLLAFGGVLLVLDVLFAPVERLRTSLPWLIPVVATIAALFGVIQITGHHSRFYVPSAPFLVVGLLAPLRGSRVGRVEPPRLAWALLLVTGVLFGRDAIGSRWNGRRLEHERAEAARYPVQTLRGQSADMQTGNAWWATIVAVSDLTSRLPAGACVAATEHGYIAAMNPSVRVLDLAGLHDPAIAHHGFSDEVLRRAAPDLIWMPHTDYVGLYFHVLESPTFRSSYDFFPGKLLYGVAIRKDSPSRAQLEQMLASSRVAGS